MTRAIARRPLAIGAVSIALVAVAGCGSAGPAVTGSTRAPSRPRALVLAQFAKGVGAISPGAAAPVWNDAAAVSAVDGSAVFSVRRTASSRLVRLDPHSGAVVSSWPVAQGLSISAVAPNGRWVALTDRRPGYDLSAGAFTELVVFDPAAGREARHLTLSGNVQPEAFSVDGSLIFALHYRGDHHYRVETVELSTGRQFDTSDRNKTISPEDMHGASVRGVMSSDRTLLATLYRNPGDKQKPAFVHVLDLEYGWSYCADLPRPFGTGSPGSDVIELTPSNTVVVAANPWSRVAEIHIEDVHTPGNAPVEVDFRGGTVASTGSAFRSTPGFSHVIAALDA
jgi:dipeptidyl aminopeptidase/acylaminoacyl peptidase